MSSSTPQAGDTVRLTDKSWAARYGNGTVQGVEGAFAAVHFPRLGDSRKLALADLAVTSGPGASRPAKARTAARETARPGKATAKQVGYAMSLLRRDSDYTDEVLGAADEAETQRNLGRMTSAQISALISQLKRA